MSQETCWPKIMGLLSPWYDLNSSIVSFSRAVVVRGKFRTPRGRYQQESFSTKPLSFLFKIIFRNNQIFPLHSFPRPRLVKSFAQNYFKGLSRTGKAPPSVLGEQTKGSLSRWPASDLLLHTGVDPLPPLSRVTGSEGCLFNCLPPVLRGGLSRV